MKGWGLLAALVVADLLLSACTRPTPMVKEVVKEVTQEVKVEVTREVVKEVVVTPTPVFRKVLRLNMGVGDVPTIDPALSTERSSVQIAEETTVGLTRQNEETAAIEPGMATRWDISEDGKTYTFHLRTDVPWVRYNAATGQVEKVKDEQGKDRMVLCKDFAYGIKRTLSPKTGSEYAYVLTTHIVGAEEFNTTDTARLSKEDLKKLEDGVGVTCKDDATLEITIKEPAGYFAAIAGMWVAHAQPGWLIVDKGDRWTEPGFCQGYGPYTLKDWHHESDITLIANPFWPGSDNIPRPKIEEITWNMLDEALQFTNYETGIQDVATVPLTEMDRVKADPVLSQELKVLPNLATYYYGFNVAKPPLDDVNVRKALSWAIDRQALIDNVTKGGQEPARWFARPGLVAAPDPKAGDDFGPPIKGDPAKAREFLAASRYKSADRLPPITLMVNSGEGHLKIAEAIQRMWKETLGVEVQIITPEQNVYLKTLREDPPQIFRLGWRQDYPDANNFDREVFRSDSSNNHTRWKNEQFDRLVDQAAIETDLAKRKALYVQAEKLMVEEDVAIAPLYWYTHVQVTRPYVQRTFSVLGGLEHIEKWDIKPHA